MLPLIRVNLHSYYVFSQFLLQKSHHKNGVAWHMCECLRHKLLAKCSWCRRHAFLKYMGNVVHEVEAPFTVWTFKTCDEIGGHAFSHWIWNCCMLLWTTMLGDCALSDLADNLYSTISYFKTCDKIGGNAFPHWIWDCCMLLWSTMLGDCAFADNFVLNNKLFYRFYMNWHEIIVISLHLHFCCFSLSSFLIWETWKLRFSYCSRFSFHYLLWLFSYYYYVMIDE